MKYPALAVLCVLLLASCATPQPVQQDRYGDSILNKALHDTLKISSSGGHGSGWGVKYDGEYTWVMTCFHVIENGQNIDGKPVVDPAPFVLHFNGGRAPMVHFGVTYMYDSIRDLALLRVKGKLPVFTPASASERQSLMERKYHPETGEVLVGGTKVVAAGFMSDIEPPIVSIGFVMSKEQKIGVTRGVLHSSGIWFGSSGGPLIHRKSGKVLGMNARIYNFQSNLGWAISIDEINDFLAIAGV